MSTFLIILAIFVAVSFIRIYWQNAQVPSLGVVDGQMAPLKKTPNNVSSQTRFEKKKVDAWPYKDSREETMAAIKTVVNAYGGATVQQETDNYLYVVFTTSLMRYKDDVEFWLSDTEQVVHFRSSSRAGKSDMGLNLKRYTELTELYNKQ